MPTFLILTLLFELILVPAARATDALPYTTRTHAYEGWSNTVCGDVRTVGMAGADEGLADSFIASLSNPSGIAMTLNGADAAFAVDWTRNSHVQDFNNSMMSADAGMAAAAYPWGFAGGYVQHYREGQPYSVSGVAGDTDLELTVREAHLSAARIFFNNHLSIGASLIVGQAERDLTPQSGAGLASESYAVGASFGAMLQTPSRYFVGLSYTLPMHYSGDAAANPTPQLPGFFEPVDVPGRLGVGVGWIPNRFFRADLTAYWVGTTPASALLSDDNVRVGQFGNIQPRIGVSYRAVDFKELWALIYAGTYIEGARQATAGTRVHGTLGVAIQPWILQFGWALDASEGYQNQLLGFGIDMMKLFEKLDLLPRSWRPPTAGWLPSPTHLSDVGLARPLVKNWKPHGPEVNAIQATLDIPGKIGQKVKQAGQDIGNFGENLVGGGKKKKNQKVKKPGRSAKPRKTKGVRPKTQAN